MLRKIGLYKHALPYYQRLTLPHGSTVLIHIGKCGGGSLKRGLVNATKNIGPIVVHMQKPPYRADLKYIIVARDPIARVESAFRWRYRLVVAEGMRDNVYRDEFDILSSYSNLNRLAEELYTEAGLPVAKAQSAMKSIHHIREDIAFYLHDLLEKCEPEQVIAVLMQESLDSDISKVFGYENSFNVRLNRESATNGSLSLLGLRNLRRFLADDYEALMKLYCWGKIDCDVFRRIV
ncbi:MAG: hypothetical protein IT472_03635 [Thermomonas sp.]|uniref:hypothetical protein n=1 Tax=Thermomonas sp. TaxID=1971895 RepID=UPI00261D22B8|nr:hypothetical protein [Thermomonas sp.]MCC7096256.1 hypothetical protein [Thermomonas sp.]